MQVSGLVPDWLRTGSGLVPDYSDWSKQHALSGLVPDYSDWSCKFPDWCWKKNMRAKNIKIIFFPDWRSGLVIVWKISDQSGKTGSGLSGLDAGQA